MAKAVRVKRNSTDLYRLETRRELKNLNSGWLSKEADKLLTELRAGVIEKAMVSSPAEFAEFLLGVIKDYAERHPIKGKELTAVEARHRRKTLRLVQSCKAFRKALTEFGPIRGLGALSGLADPRANPYFEFSLDPEHSALIRRYGSFEKTVLVQLEKLEHLLRLESGVLNRMRRDQAIRRASLKSLTLAWEKRSRKAFGKPRYDIIAAVSSSDLLGMETNEAALKVRVSESRRKKR